MNIREIIKEELAKVFKEGLEQEVPRILRGPRGFALGMAGKGVGGTLFPRSIESPFFGTEAEVCKFYSNWNPSNATMQESITSEEGNDFSIVGDPAQVCALKEDNYPAGAKNDPNAPYNQVDSTKPGEKADVIRYDVTWYDRGIALLKDASGNLYAFNTDSIEMDDYQPYADREETFEGFDEDGDPMLEYGDWELDGEVVENYINDNLDSITIGKGLDDYEGGNSMMTMVDDELRQDLSGIAPYIKSELDRKRFLEALGGISEGIEKIVDKKTMDTPTGTLFIMDVGASGE